MHKYTEQQIKFLQDNINGTSYKDLRLSFNNYFELNLSLEQIKSICQRHKLKNGLNSQFKKKQAPWNKGKKKDWVGGEDTQFKKGNIPKNYKPVGSERINVDGYIEVKVEAPSRWKPKHVVIWESVNGKVPNGHVIIFGDSNKLNLDIENLILVTRRQLLELNQKGLIFNNRESTKTGLLIADLNIKVKEKEKDKT